MSVLTQPVELHSIEKLREQELEEARAIQGVMLPGQPLRTDCVTISHEFQPAAEVGGDFLDYFLLPDGMIACTLATYPGKAFRRRSTPRWRLATLRGVHKTGQPPARSSPS